MSTLDRHFKCPKSLKIQLMGQSRAARHQVYEAYNSFSNWKKRVAVKRDSKAEA
jgi:hypothetical protein